MNPMYPHKLTAWRPTEDGRDIAWRKVGVISCRFDMERSVTMSPSGEDASWIASIIIPSSASDSPLLRGDKVALGSHLSSTPIQGSMRVIRCDPVSINRSTPDHWEAEAK